MLGFTLPAAVALGHSYVAQKEPCRPVVSFRWAFSERSPIFELRYVEQKEKEIVASATASYGAYKNVMQGMLVITSLPVLAACLAPP